MCCQSLVFSILALPARLPITDPVLIVAISALIFLVAPLLMQRLRIPGLVGLILAGALVGPNGLNLLARSNTIILLGTVGLLYLMFIVGIEIDLFDFRRYRHRSIGFGAATFLLPQVLGTGVMLLLGYSLPASILVASMFASHTLLAYPIALRFGIGKNRAVTTAVGGTIITDTAALLVLAVVAASTEGSLDRAFWIRLTVGLAIYTAVVSLALPRLARWFFRHEKTSGIAEYVFVFASLFAGAFFAEVAGVEAIVGAFLVGLALNPLIPEQSPLASRIHFVGEAVFIPFFLLSVGMLVDVRVLAGDIKAWQVMLAMTGTVTITKWLAARSTQQLFGYSSEEGWVIFGLSVPQAAATLAAALVGVRIGLFDDAILNGTILMILVTCVIGPWIVEKYGRIVALHEESQPYDAASAPQRILVPVANPATIDGLIDLALAVRVPASKEPVHATTVVPDEADRTTEQVALAEKMLKHAVSYGAAADVQVVPMTRVDHNFASGICRAAVETRTSTIIIGWDARRTTASRIFGSVLDQLLEVTKQHVFVAKVGHPLNMTRRVRLLVPFGTDRLPGFLDVIRDLKRLASRVGAGIEVLTVGASPELYERHIKNVTPDTALRVERTPNWVTALERIRQDRQLDDLVVMLSARRGAVSWAAPLERIPARLGEMEIESFIVIFPAEAEIGDPTVPPSALPARRERYLP